MEAIRMDGQMDGQTLTGGAIPALHTEIVVEMHDHYGYRGWLAQIVGADAQYGLAREFLHPSERSQSRSGKTGDKTYVIDHEGIYQIGGTKRDNEIRMVRQQRAKGLVWCAIDIVRATAMAKLMDEGKTFEEARLATKVST